MNDLSVPSTVELTDKPAPAAIFILDPRADRIVDANRQAITLLGFGRRELLETPISRIHPDEMPRILDLAEAAALAGAHGDYGRSSALTCITKSGDRIPVDVSACVLRTIGGPWLFAVARPSGAVAQLAAPEIGRGERDFAILRTRFESAQGLATREKAPRLDAERQSNLLPRSYTCLMEAAHHGVIEIDADGRVTFANSCAGGLLGAEPERLIGRSAADFFHGESRPDGGDPLDADLRLTLKSGAQARRKVTTLRHRDGKTVLVEYTSVALRDEGTIIGALLALREISAAEARRPSEANRPSMHQACGPVAPDSSRTVANSGSVRGSATILVGRSSQMEVVHRRIRQVAPTMAHVLVTGESGTGKELVARLIHEHSPRHTGPMVRVNCAAIPRDLFESEFFGHAKGAFTGAHSDRKGRFEMARGGTLFLDEIGELPLESQGKLLHVIEGGSFERIGDGAPRIADVRIVAATNRDLLGEVARGQFRHDLYYRLSVFPIHLCPLRQRKDDIGVLAVHLLSVALEKVGRSDLRISPEAVRVLEHCDWPGNVRQLQNVIERAVIEASGEDELRFDLSPSRATSDAREAADTGQSEIVTEAMRKSRDRDNILTALERAHWRVSGLGGAADLLGVNPTTLRSRMRAFGIEIERGAHDWYPDETSGVNAPLN